MISIIDYFEDKVKHYPSNPLVWEKREGLFHATTYSECHEIVKKVAAGLLYFGINKGDRVALLSEGRRDWLLSELAILYCGAINVPLSTKLEEGNDLQFRINHSGARIIMVSGFQLPKIRNIINKLPLVEKIIILDHVEALNEAELPWNDLHKLGMEFLASNEQLVEARRQEVKPSDIANICYTSGTTADPKGIMLSHRNYTANVEQAFSYIDIPPYYRTLVVLPWDHAFAHTAALYAFMYKGASIASVQAGANPTETLRNFANNMMEVQPHVLMSVPAMAKNFKKNIENAIRERGSITTLLFRASLSYSYWYNGTGNNMGKGLKIITLPLKHLFDRIIFSKIRSKFGGNLKFFIGGGALLDIELQKFFYAIGVPMYQGYGLTEAAPIISANTPRFHKLGSSGKVVNNLQLKICDEKGNELPSGVPGEIVVKGENVMIGYWKNEKATRDAIRDGWLYTGDLGYVDDENYLQVLGRFKSLLISHDGEKYSPEGIEEAIIDNCDLIDQFMLHNNQNPYTVGVVVPNREAIKRQLGNYNLPSDEDKAVMAIKSIQKQLLQFKKGGKHENMFPERWLPSAILIAPEPFTESNRMINSTLKIVRREIENSYKNEIALLFSAEGKDFLNANNKNNIKIYVK